MLLTPLCAMEHVYLVGYIQTKALAIQMQILIRQELTISAFRSSFKTLSAVDIHTTCSVFKKMFKVI